MEILIVGEVVPSNNMKYLRFLWNFIEITEDDVVELNSLTSIDDFPTNFIKPTLSKKVLIKDRQLTGGSCAVAKEDIREGEILCHSDGSVLSKPIKYSWTIEKGYYLLGPGIFDHSCTDFNCIIDDEFNIVAKRDIHTGELLTFNYLTSEYDMSGKFECKCGSDGCFGMIKGFKYLSEQDKECIMEYKTTRYIRNIYKESKY